MQTNKELKSLHLLSDFQFPWNRWSEKEKEPALHLNMRMHISRGRFNNFGSRASPSLAEQLPRRGENGPLFGPKFPTAELFAPNALSVFGKVIMLE